MNCTNCNKETINPKFCSTKCSGIFQAKITKGTRRVHYKCECGAEVSRDRKYCVKCFDEKFLRINLTLQEAIYTEHGKPSAFALVRTRARDFVKKNKLPRICYNCNYSKHIEICHIIPINQFNPKSLLSDINHPSNLSILCPNCHWEFDHNLLKEIESIEKYCLKNNIKYKSYLKNQNVKLKPKRKYKTIKNIICKICKKNFETFNYKQKYCSYVCSYQGSRKIQRPPKEQLEQELKESNFLALGRKYGVSDNAIRKWAKSYGII